MGVRRLAGIWMAGVRGTAALVNADLRCPVPAPRQVFAIGLIQSHAEAGTALPTAPATLTKSGVAGRAVRRRRDRRRRGRLR
jgi:hypothetical protein